jgi:hypothetical protein
MTFRPDPKPEKREKKAPYQLKRTPIKKKFGKPKGDGALMEKLWDTMDPDLHVSFVSGENLERYAEYRDDEGMWHKTSAFYSMWHHVLKKEEYPDFILYPENLILLTPPPREHIQVHNVAFSDLIKLDRNWTRVMDLFEVLHTRYYCHHVFQDGVCKCGMTESDYTKLLNKEI